MGVLKVRKGEILEAETDLEYKNSLGQEAEISKGEKSVIGFDGLIHCLCYCAGRYDGSKRIFGNWFIRISYGLA